MGRIRYIKPEFFTDSDLGDLPATARILFAGLWTLADRDGRLEDKPRDIRVQVLPHDDTDRSAPLTEQLLDLLHNTGLIFRYVVDGVGYIAIPSWAKHQKPYTKEPASILPDPTLGLPRGNLGATLGLATLTERKGKVKGKERSPSDDGGLLITQEDPPPTPFDEFWDAYPRKVKKAAAQTAFDQLSAAEQRAAIRAANNRSWYDRESNTPRDKIPHATTFLHKSVWEDWVAGLPDGYEIRRPPSGTQSLSAQNTITCSDCGRVLTPEEKAAENAAVLCGDRVDWYCAKCAKGER